MVPQNWIIDCLKMYKISDEIIKFIKKTTKDLWAEFTAERKTLAEMKIHCGIFQGDVLSPLLFLILICNNDDFSESHTEGNAQGATNNLNHKKRSIT